MVNTLGFSVQITDGLSLSGLYNQERSVVSSNRKHPTWTTLGACEACHHEASLKGPQGHSNQPVNVTDAWLLEEYDETVLQIIWHQHDRLKIPNAKSGHLPGFDATGFGWCWLSSRPCFDMLCIPTNYLPQGATGSHFNLWCLLQWDIAGFKKGNKGGTTLKNLYT